MARDIDRVIVEDAARNHFVTTRTRLRELGISDPSIARRVGGLLRRFSAGVYVVGETDSPTTTLAGAMSAVPDGAVSRFSAAKLHGLPVTFGRHLSIVVPNGRRVSLPEMVRVHQTVHLPSDDITTVSGLRTCTVERALCDVARISDAARLQHLIEWSITHRRMSSASFLGCVRAYRRRGRDGSAVLGEIASIVLDGEAMPASELERRGLELFQRAGIQGFEMHFRPPWSDGVSGIVDFAWPAAKVIVELDGRRWHSTTLALREDRRRDRVAQAHGWIVLRFGWQEVVERPRSTTNELRSVIDRRLAAKSD